MDSFKIRVSHTTHSSLASNINPTKYLYIKIPDFKFILDYAEIYGEIKEEGIRKLVEPAVTTIIVSAKIVLIEDGFIFEVTKNKFIKDCEPKIPIEVEKQRTVHTRNGIINLTIPPPPKTHPPRLSHDVRIIQHAKKNGDRRSTIICRNGNNCWRKTQGICSYKHPNSCIETVV